MMNNYFYTLYVDKNSMVLDVREEGIPEEKWDSMTIDEKEEALSDFFNCYASNLADMGWYSSSKGELKREGLEYA